MAKMDDSLVALEARLIELARTYQQDYYEISSDWNRYEQYELNYLRDYIGYAMFGLPDSKAKDKSKENADHLQNEEKNETDNENMKDAGFFVYEEKQQEAIQLIFQKVVRYANAYDSKGSIFCGVIYNVIFNKEQTQEALPKKKVELAIALAATNDEDERKALERSKPEVQVYPVPVFKVKQIRNEIGKNFVAPKSEKIYYIDNSGRVYDGFADYLDNNTLPLCTMVYPKDGKYQIDGKLYTKLIESKQNIDDLVSVVWLEIRQSPADSTMSKILSKGDTATTIITAASMTVIVASMFTPIGPAVALAGGIGGGIGGMWGFGRSAQHLADRGLHDETINPIEDRSAAGAWLGIAGGTVGLAATGSSALLSRAVRTGATISRTATLTYDVVLVGNLVVNGVGIGFKSYDMYSAYQENKEISPLDVAMLAGHLFFFGNSVMNMRFARTVIESSQAQLLKDYESSLRSNRHRKEFQRMARNTRAAGTNDVSSNEEIIRGINRIDNKDEFFQAMVRNRKSLSASSARAAFSDGKVTVNSVLTIDPIEFSNLPKDVRTEIIRNVVNPQTVSSSGSNTNNSPGVSNTFGTLNPVNSGSKSTISPGTQPENSGGVKPSNSAEVEQNNLSQGQSKISAEPKPSNSAGVTSSNVDGTQPKNSGGVKPNTVAGTQSKDSGAAKSTNSAGIKGNDPPESTSNIPAKTKLKTSSGAPSSNSAETKLKTSSGAPSSNSAETKPKDLAGSKSNFATGTKPKDAAGSKSNVATGTKPKDSTGGVKPKETAAGVRTKIPPNETSYKSFNTKNGMILNDFCTRHASTMLLTAPPQVADFANVLGDLRSMQNYAVIFVKLLEIAYKIFQNLPRDEEIVLGNVLALIVEFLWNYVKLCIRRAKPGIPIDDPVVRTCLDGALQELWVNVEEKIDVWVIAFKTWLRETFPQSMNISK